MNSMEVTISDYGPIASELIKLTKYQETMNPKKVVKPYV